jgi:GTP pyrophosphokinase
VLLISLNCTQAGLSLGLAHDHFLKFGVPFGTPNFRRSKSLRMKTAPPLESNPQRPPIVDLVGLPGSAAGEIDRARNFAAPLLKTHLLDSSEDALAHADGVVGILQNLGAPPSLLAASYLIWATDSLNDPAEVITRAFGADDARLAVETRKLMHIQRTARQAQTLDLNQQQTERVRKMLLAFSRDLRVVLLRLASRLQTLRFYAAHKLDCPIEIAAESLHVFATLANRLGLWPIKWELEDLAFRFLQPQAYKTVARQLDEKRVQREQQVEALRQDLSEQLKAWGISAQVQGRPKHLYSIWKKMQGKGLHFNQVFDVSALRVIVADVPACYAVLARLHAHFKAIDAEFDDYIAKPKPNGYQSLHTVVHIEDGRTVEIQIRTQEMHEHAELGVAAHWAYKEAGAQGYSGKSSADEAAARAVQARKAVLHQLLAWERDLTGQQKAQASDTNAMHAHESHIDQDLRKASSTRRIDDTARMYGHGITTTLETLCVSPIYVFTPQATIIELPSNATPIDFAYAVHTDLGHRCRGAKIDGALLPLNTPLANGQTVEILAAKDTGIDKRPGPSRDWLNPELGYLQSHRAKAKVRGWFNNLAQAQTIQKGREQVEKLLQREARKDPISLDALASRLGFSHAQALFESVGKDEFSLHNIERLLRENDATPTPPDENTLLPSLQQPSKSATSSAHSHVQVVGLDSMLTTLARCCRPAPPDAIVGYITRSKGVAIHRKNCSNLAHMSHRMNERVIAVNWGAEREGACYSVDISLQISPRPALLRDIAEALSKEKVNVTAMNTPSGKATRSHGTWMVITVEIQSAIKLTQLLMSLTRVQGVHRAQRR